MLPRGVGILRVNLVEHAFNLTTKHRDRLRTNNHASGNLFIG